MGTASTVRMPPSSTAATALDSVPDVGRLVTKVGYVLQLVRHDDPTEWIFGLEDGRLATSQSDHCEGGRVVVATIRSAPSQR